MYDWEDTQTLAPFSSIFVNVLHQDDVTTVTATTAPTPSSDSSLNSQSDNKRSKNASSEGENGNKVMSLEELNKLLVHKLNKVESDSKNVREKLMAMSEIVDMDMSIVYDEMAKVKK